MEGVFTTSYSRTTPFNFYINLVNVKQFVEVFEITNYKF